ncbi:hypothetical protein DPEC_G00181960 [Dallia pectoralis]|uniref:Uncharacterized protein n=1 Tax=Dallia pectoralis TaxID=75939 RepID=A0ACC2GAQ3_DALPE|nr:hypothetical protein DPEC_G00181960 [Dallia pectoralis]
MWKYQLPGYELKLIGELQKQQNSSLYCDTLLQSEDVSVPAHSCILAALSPYLSRALATDPPPLHVGHRRPLKLHAVGARTLLKLVGLFYSGELEGEDPKEREEVMAAAYKLGIAHLVEEDEGGGWRRTLCSVREAGVQTEPVLGVTDVGTGPEEKRDRATQVEVLTRVDTETQVEVLTLVDTETQVEVLTLVDKETQVEVLTLVDTETQTMDNKVDADARHQTSPPDVIPLIFTSPPHRPLLLTQGCSEGPQLATHTSPPCLSAQSRASTLISGNTSPQVTAMASNGTSSFRIPTCTPEPEVSTEDITKFSPSYSVHENHSAPSDDMDDPRFGLAGPECTVVENGVTERRMETKTQGKRVPKQQTSHTGQGKGGRMQWLANRGVIGRKCMSRLRQLNTQTSFKLKLKRRTEGLMWEVANRKERVRTVPLPACATGHAVVKKSTQDVGCKRTRPRTKQHFEQPQSPGPPQGTPLKPVTSLCTPLKPDLLQGSPFGPAFLTPPPDLPLSPIPPPLALQAPSFFGTPHPPQDHQLDFTQPQVEESEEEIGKMLEDVMMGLDILPSQVLQRNCDQHHLHGEGRQSACSCSRHPDHTVGPATQYMCSYDYETGSDSLLANGTVFHSVMSSHFVTTTTACTVTSNFQEEPRPLNPHCCSTCHSPATCHPGLNPLCCSGSPSGSVKCDQVSYYPGALPCSNGPIWNHEELRNQNAQNREFQIRNSQIQSVSCDGVSNAVAVHSGTTASPLQPDRAFPQCHASLSYTREDDLDPRCRQGSGAHLEVPSTAGEPDCPMEINGETSSSQVRGRTSPGQANGETSQSYISAREERVIPQEIETDAMPQGSEAQSSQTHPQDWEELFLPKCLSPIHSQEPPPPRSLVKRFPLVPAAPFQRAPQISKLQTWLCPSMARLEFPLATMLQFPRCHRDQGSSKDEHLTDGQGKTACFSGDSQNAGLEEIRKRIEKTVMDASAAQTQEKPKAKTKEREDEMWEPPENCVRRKRTEVKKEQPGNKDTTEPPRKRSKCRVSTRRETRDEESPLVSAAGSKQERGTHPSNGQVKISLCSVSLSSNNILARCGSGRSPFDTSTLSSYTPNEEAKGRPEETKRLRRKTGNPVEAPQDSDEDVKSVPLICTRSTRRSLLKLHQEGQKPDLSSETPCPSSSELQHPEKAVESLQIPAVKRKRGRPRKIRPGDEQFSTSNCVVPMATVSHNNEDIKHRKEGELKEKGQESVRNNFVDLFKSFPTLPEPETDLLSLGKQRAQPSVLEDQVISNSSEMLHATFLETLPSGQPQFFTTESSGETRSDQGQMSTPAVELTDFKVPAPTVSLKKFKELLKHRHQKTRRFAKRRENKQTECDFSFYKSTEEKGKQTESNQPEENDRGPKISTCVQKEIQPNLEERNEFGNAKIETVRENANSSRNDGELQEVKVTEKIVSQLTDEGNKEVTDGVSKDSKEVAPNMSGRTNKLEDQVKSDAKRKKTITQGADDVVEYGFLEMNVPKKADMVQVHQSSGYMVTEEISGDGEEVMGLEREEFSKKTDDPTVFPDDEDSGIRAVDKEFSTITSVKRSPHNNIDPQDVDIDTVAPQAPDLILSTPLDLKAIKLTSSRRIPTRTWEPEEEVEVEVVDILECSPDILPRVWEAGLDRSSTELTEEDEEDDEVDVTGEETG